MKTLNLLRAAHALDIFFSILKILGSTPKNYAKHCFTFKILDTIKMFFYLATIIYAIYHETHTNTTKTLNDGDYFISHAEVWILIELVVFFAQTLCSTFFILGMQIRGELGHNNDPLFQRYKVDALHYYQQDIDWFAYMMVLLCLHIEILTKHLAVPSKNNNTLKEAFSAYMIIFSLVRMGCLMPLRYSDRKYKKVDIRIWICLFVLEALGSLMMLLMDNIKGSNTFASQIIDAVSMVAMFIIYKYHIAAQEEPPDSQQPLLRCLG
jgi:hypothetical protein